jgi:hypothetical protein
VAHPAEVFVSYSRDDESRVFDLAAKLRAAGVSLWIDQGGLDGASQWSEQIVKALESAKVLLLIVTESAVHSDNVAKEVVLVSERKGHILPVYLEPTVIPPTLKYQLAGIRREPECDRAVSGTYWCPACATTGHKRDHARPGSRRAYDRPSGWYDRTWRIGRDAVRQYQS